MISNILILLLKKKARKISNYYYVDVLLNTFVETEKHFSGYFDKCEVEIETLSIIINTNKCHF